MKNPFTQDHLKVFKYKSENSSKRKSQIYHDHYRSDWWKTLGEEVHYSFILIVQNDNLLRDKLLFIIDVQQQKETVHMEHLLEIDIRN